MTQLLSPVLSPLRILRSVPNSQPADSSGFLRGYEAAQQELRAQGGERRAQDQAAWSNELHARDRAERDAASQGLDEYFQSEPTANNPTPTPQPQQSASMPPQDAPSSPAVQSGLGAIKSAPIPAPVATPPDDGGPPIPAMESNVGKSLSTNNGPLGSRLAAISTAPPQSPSAFNLMPGVGDDGPQTVGTPPTPQPLTETAEAPPAAAPPPPVSSPTQVASAPPSASPLSSVKLQRPDRSRLDMVLGKAMRHASPMVAAGYVQKGTNQQFSDYQDETENALKILQLADQGQIDQANVLAQRTGQQIPPQLLQNGRARQAMSTALNVGKQIGADHDHDWVARFTQSYLKTGDVTQAQRDAGSFKPAPKPNTFRTQQMQVGPKTHIGSFDTSTGALTDTGQEAPPVKTAGAETREKQNFSWMTAPKEQGGLGMDAKTAETIIFQVKENPGAKARTISTMANAIVNARGGKMDAAIAEATKAYADIEKMVTKQPGGAVVPGNETEMQNELTDEKFNAPPSPAAAPDASQPAAPRLDQQRTEGSVNGRDVYSVDGGHSWYWKDTDTPYDGEFE